jgi:acyl-coenzyme A thioesterase PaaI-like protein
MFNAECGQRTELRKPAQRDLVAQARLLELGKRLATGEVIIRSGSEDAPVAHVASTCSIPTGSS